jgi:hypothetical protein
MSTNLLGSLLSRGWVIAGVGLAGLTGVGLAVQDDGAAKPVPPAAIPAAIDPATAPNPLTRAAGGERTIDETADPTIAKLAHKYQPILVVARADRFWPVSLKTVLSLTVAGKTTCRHGGACPPAPTYGDLGPPGIDKDYLSYPGSPKNAQAEFEAVMQTLEIPESPATWITNVAAHPYKTAQFYVYFAGRVPDVKDNARTFDEKLPKSGLVNIQYWFFYPLNYLPIRFRDPGKLGVDPTKATKHNTNYHEGDWEHVSVLLSPSAGSRGVSYSPRYLYMARHDNEGHVYRWSNPNLEWEGDHPVVYSAFGGHTSYRRCGPQARWPKKYRVRVRLPINDQVICEAPSPKYRRAPVGPLFRFGPNTTLVELKRDSWACWRGRFGRLKGGGVENGPKAPLRQGENSKARECQ